MKSDCIWLAECFETSVSLYQTEICCANRYNVDIGHKFQAGHIIWYASLKG